MFLKVTETKSGNYFSVCETYRDDKGVKKHRVLLNLGNEDKFQEFLKMLKERHLGLRKRRIEAAMAARANVVELSRDNVS